MTSKPSLRPITTLWRLSGGQRIRVCDMDDAHLLNTIRFITRTLQASVGTLPPGAYSSDTPEYLAALAAWEGMMRAGISDLEPYYHDMMEEMLHRGLSLETRMVFRDKGRLLVGFSGRGPVDPK